MDHNSAGAGSGTSYDGYGALYLDTNNNSTSINLSTF